MAEVKLPEEMPALDTHECLLARSPYEYNYEYNTCCRPNMCPTCGWQVDEARRRNELLHRVGLTLCSDGLERLINKRGG